MIKTFILLFLIIILTGVVIPRAFAQTQDRRMIFDEYDCDEPAAESGDEDSRCLVELVDVQIDGRKIISGQPFVADENWLKNLKIKIKNVSGKPFVFVNVSFGLIDGLYEELVPSASWAWGFGLSRGQISNPNDTQKKKPTGPVVLKPNEETELTFADLPDLDKKSSLMQVIGKTSQIVLTTSTVYFGDGKEHDSFIYIRKKPE